MHQWFAAKAAHPDALVFFRMGDFYELFFADADAASSALDIALTVRGEHAGAPIPMCGVPAHTADLYLARLIRRGFRVAIAEQTEDPKQARARGNRGPLDRQVVRVVTPGTVMEDALLDAGRPTLLLALAQLGPAMGAAWAELSTGLFATEELAPGDLPSLLGRLSPAEIVAPEGLSLPQDAPRGPARVVPRDPRRLLAEAFGAASLDAFGSFSDAEAAAAGLLLDYVRVTQAGQLPHLAPPTSGGTRGVLALDAATRASLEIVSPRERDGPTLLASVDHTLTAGGARLLAARLAAPLTDPAAIAARQDAWAWLSDAPAAPAIRDALRRSPDMARALGRLSLGRVSPRDLGSVRDGLTAAALVADALAGVLPQELGDAREQLRADVALLAELSRALVPSPPLRAEDGACVAPGFDGELDAQRRLRDDSRAIIAGLQSDYAQRFGAASLRIRHHAQLGYVIEAKGAAARTLMGNPALTLRQSLVDGGRWSTTELADLDARINAAAEAAGLRERRVLAHLAGLVTRDAGRIGAAADALARVDCAQSAAVLATSGRWCRPVVTDDAAFSVTALRHPVVEDALRAARGPAFVPNEAALGPGRRFMLLTGPNMAGKSTFLRQNALAVVLAQAGLPVPATEARIGIADRLFSRVGAADDLARGRSTFMVEMTEMAAILRQAGPRSFVIVDEIGRGTATWDGLAIAWAVTEALHETIRCRTIFATHFHELARLADRLPNLRPHTMRVREWKGDVVFLHEVAEGAGGRSYGVQVARLAGVPAAVVARAQRALTTLERREDIGALPLFSAAPPPPDPLRAALDALDPDALSPRAALEALARLKAIAAEG